MFRDLATLLGSPQRIKALAYVLKHPEGEGIASECAAVTGLSRQVALKELNALVRLDIIRARTANKEKKFFGNENDILFTPLKNLLVDATTPDDKMILGAFRGTRGLWMMVAAGALVDDSHSSVDLLIVCRNPEDAKIAKAVKKIEAYAAIPVRYAVLEVDEYLGRRQAYDRLLRDIFEYSHRVLLERGAA